MGRTGVIRYLIENSLRQPPYEGQACGMIGCALYVITVMVKRINEAARVAWLFGVVLAIRIGGASDLYQNDDQTRSLSFTADVVLNRNWILPRDITGQPARKPPLINWMGALLPALGVWSEWALKLPSILGGALALGFCFGAARRLAGSDSQLRQDAGGFAAAAAALYLACPETVKHMYFFRPDMLNVAWLTGAWFFSMALFDDDATRARWNALGFWLCTGLAALTKGTTSLIALIYLPFAARLLGGSWKAFARTGWWWGVPLALGIFALWAGPLVVFHGEFVKDILLREETVSRVAGDPWWFWKALVTSWEIPYWFCERFLPWSLFALLALVMRSPRRWFDWALAPAVLWVLVTLLFFVPVQHRGGAYFMPAYPAAAALAAWFLIAGQRKWPLDAKALFRMASGIALVFVLHKAFLSDDARRGVGDSIKAFSKQAVRLVGNEPVAFVHVGLNPVIILMGRYQAGELPAAERSQAKWLVCGVSEDDLNAVQKELSPVVISRRLERMSDRGKGHYLCLIKQNG